MNTRTHPSRLSFVMPTFAALASWLAAHHGVFAQGYTVTNIVVPGAESISISALNVSGQLAGTYAVAGLQRAFVWEQGTALDLGALGGSNSVANALNRFGQVAGYATTVGDVQFHAFLGVGRTLFDLGTLGGANSAATAISDSGHVAGFSDFSLTGVDFHAFLNPSGGTMIDLGTLGGSISSATAVNNVAQVIGDSTLAGDVENHAFLYSGSLRDLGTLGGGYSSPAALNDAGWVTGESSLAGEVEIHAFLFDGATLRDLGTLGGTFSGGYAMNSAGDIVGDSLLSDDIRLHAFLYRAGTMPDLGTLGGLRSSAFQINNNAQVVGAAEDANGTRHAFLWQAGTMRDLNSLLPANSGWELTDAYFINDQGQIAGAGLFQGVAAWYLLTPRLNENQPPVANAGPDQTVPCTTTSSTVSLDGSRSSDPDGDALTFQWFEAGVALATGANPTVTLALGTHTIVLRVTDSAGASAEDTVVIAVVDTAAPVFTCPPDRTALSGENGQAAVPDLLTTLVVSDNGTPAAQLVKTQTPPAGTLLACGAHTIVVTVTDLAGNAATCSVRFTVLDVTPPVVSAPELIPVGAGPDCRATVPSLAGLISATDNCTPAEALTLTQEPGAGTPVSHGRHEVRVTVRDQAGNAGVAVVILEVADRTGPVIHSIKATPCHLTQVNRKMVPIQISVQATDSCDPSPRCRIVSVTSSDPVTGHSDSTAPDWEVTGDLTLEVRAEVASNFEPRVYTICVACTDASGNKSARKVTVTVDR